jgi:hypothetical protein
MIEQSPDVKELTIALHGAQGMLGGVLKDGKNPHFKNRYATLEAVIHAAKPALQAHGLCFVQAPTVGDDGIGITTQLMHISGQWMRSTLPLPLTKRDPQGVGSAITYGCRYSLMAMLGLPPTDDVTMAVLPPDDDAEATRPQHPPVPYTRASFSSGIGPGKDALPIADAGNSDDGLVAHKYLMACLKVVEVSTGPRAKLVQWWAEEKPKRVKYGLTQEQIDQIRQAIEFRFPAATALEKTMA